MQNALIKLATRDAMAPYVTYRMHWAARPLTSHEQRVSDEQIGRLSKSVSGALARLRWPRRQWVRHVRYGTFQSVHQR